MLQKKWIVWGLVAALLLAAPALFAGGGNEDKAGQAKTNELKPNSGEAMDQYTTRIAKALAQGKDITLRVILTWDAPGEALIKVIPQWEAATGIKVKYEKLSTIELSQKVNLELSSGQPQYDVIQYDRYIHKPVLENPNLLNLDPYIKKYNPHFETMMTGLESWGKADDGTNRMLPFYWCTYTMVYRKDLLEDPKEQAAFQKKYGYRYDPNNLTFDKSYKDVAEFFTRDTNGDGKIDFWGSAEMFAPYAAGDTFHARYLNYWKADKSYLSDPQTGKTTVNDESARAVLKDLIAVLDKGSFVPEVLQVDWASILGVFGSGRVAMALQYTPTWVPLQSPSSEFKISGTDKVGFTHVPGVTGHARSTQACGWVSFIPKNSPIPEIAYLFLLWASSEKMDREMALTTLHNPVRQATYKDPAVLKANPSFAAQFMHKEGQKSTPPHLIYEEEQLLLSNAMAALATGERDLDKLLSTLEKAINDKWAEVKQK